MCVEGQHCPEVIVYRVAPKDSESAKKTRQTELRYTGEYSIKEQFKGDVTSEDYDVTYQVNGVAHTSFTVTDNSDPDVNIVVTNTERPIILTATKVWENIPDNKRADVKVVPERSTDGVTWNEIGESQDIKKQDKELSVSWKLDRFDTNGKRYQYRVKELTELPNVSRRVDCQPADGQSHGSVKCTVTNTAKPGSILWSKVDADDTDKYLEGSVWTLAAENQEPKTVEDCVAESVESCLGLDKDPRAGKFEVLNLAWGKWDIQEQEAPFGYLIDEEQRSVEINAEKLEADLGKIENHRIKMPALPLTGGLGRDHFYIAGTVLLVVAAGLIWRNRRHVN
nr:SpaA isopeptide-forming pilin-related protein [Arcanobacterium phocae]